MKNMTHFNNAINSPILQNISIALERYKMCVNAVMAGHIFVLMSIKGQLSITLLSIFADVL